MSKSNKIFSSNHGFKCFWTVEDFTRCRSSEGLIIKSSTFIADVLFRTEWYVEIQISDESFAVILRKSKGVPLYNRLNISIHLLTNNGWQRKAEHFRRFEEDQGEGASNLTYNTILNETLTMCIHMWNDTTKNQNGQCVMTSEMLDETEILHFPFQKLPIVRPSDLFFPAFKTLEQVPKEKTKSNSIKPENSYDFSGILKLLNGIRNLKPSDKGTQTETPNKFNIFNDLENSHHLFKEKKLRYVFLQTEKIQFAVYKALLCEQSPVFKAMFEEDEMGNDSTTIEVNDIDSDTLSLLLQYLHFEPLDSLKWDSAAKLFQAAHKYQIEQLKIKCISFLKMELSEESVCDTYLLADMYQENELMQNVLEYLYKNSEKVFCSTKWKSYTK